MNFYIGTPYFTLIPKELFDNNTFTNVLSDMFELDNNNLNIKYVFIEQFNAYMVYAIDKTICNKMTVDKELYPLALYFIDNVKNINGYNKVILNIDKKNNITHIVIAQDKELKLINTYSTGNFKDALYYLFLALKNLQINAALTNICIYNIIDDKKADILNNYFNKIEIGNIDCNLITEFNTQQ